jgi:hypothetical protein
VIIALAIIKPTGKLDGVNVKWSETAAPVSVSVVDVCVPAAQDNAVTANSEGLRVQDAISNAASPDL